MAYDFEWDDVPALDDLAGFGDSDDDDAYYADLQAQRNRLSDINGSGPNDPGGAMNAPAGTLGMILGQTLRDTAGTLLSAGRNRLENVVSGQRDAARPVVSGAAGSASNKTLITVALIGAGLLLAYLLLRRS